MRFLLLLTICFFCCASSQKRWREVLLDQAHERILTWYTNPSLLEPPETRSGITLRMLKEDQSCGGDKVPVTFAEFIVKGARPIDIFNTMLDTAKQKSWNPQMSSATSLGEWKSEGARAWAVVFDIPLINDREFLQWQVAEANFTHEDFWLVFSTEDNGKLKKVRPIQSGATESQNCLGAYHITKHATGAHVIITQQVNAHPFFMFPMHQVLKLFPVAWSGTLDFVHQMSENSKKLAAFGSASNFTDAPRYMLQGPTSSSHEAEQSSLPIVGRAEAFPALLPRKDSQATAFLGSGVFLAIVACLTIAFAVAGVGVGRLLARRIETKFAKRFTVDSREPSLDSAASALEHGYWEEETLL